MDLLVAAAAALGGGKKPKECQIHHVPTREVRRGDTTDQECAECVRLHRAGGETMLNDSFDDVFQRELASQRRLVDIVAEDAVQVLAEARMDDLQQMAESTLEGEGDDKPTTLRVEWTPKTPAGEVQLSQVEQTDEEQAFQLWLALREGTVKREEIQPEMLRLVDEIQARAEVGIDSRPAQPAEEEACSKTETSTTQAEPQKSNASQPSSPTRNVAKKKLTAKAKKPKGSKPNAGRSKNR